MLRDGQAGFAGALLDADLPVPDGIVDPEGRPAPKRFAVYRNNVIVSLTEALAASYPAVVTLLGADYFKQMARAHVTTHPPQTPLLNEYGREFPRYLEGLAQLKKLPFLPDVARLDRIWLDAYHAADAVVLNPAALSGLNDEALVAARFHFLPATRLLRSAYPVVSLWNAGRTGNAAANIDPTRPETALVTRPDVEVGVHALAPAAGLFIEALMKGDTLGDAAETASAKDESFDLAGALSVLIASGAAMGVDA